MKQSLVTRKNRKLREIQRLYPAREGEALLPAGHRAARAALPAAARLVVASASASENGVVGAVYLTREEIAARVAELGAEIAAGVRRPRSDSHRAAEVERRLPRRSHARTSDSAHARRDRACSVHRRTGRRRPAPEGRRCAARGTSRPAGRGRRRHGPDAALPLQNASLCATPRASPQSRCSTARTGAWSTSSRCASSGSPFRTSSSPATASGSTSAGARSPISTSSARSRSRAPLPKRPSWATAAASGRLRIFARPELRASRLRAERDQHGSTASPLTRTSKCRCGPEEFPVEPTSETVSPCDTD